MSQYPYTAEERQDFATWLRQEYDEDIGYWEQRHDRTAKDDHDLDQLTWLEAFWETYKEDKYVHGR